MAVELAATEYGAGAPVAILHGLFGSGRNWATIARRLAAHHRIVAFDLRNHGASPWVDTMGYVEMAQDVRAAMLARGHEHYALIGHSMGGKVAMSLALSEPTHVERLVVVDIAPVAYPVAFLFYVRAMRAVDLTVLSRRREADEVLARGIPNAEERGFLLQSLDFSEHPPRWRLNLAAIETALSDLSGFPTPPTGAHYDGPALFVAGAKSRAVQAEYEAAIRALFPKTELARVADAGHWVHAEQPAEFLALVEPFLAR